MKSDYDAQNLPEIPHAHIAILQAEWYSDLSDVMVKHCTSILQSAKVKQIEQHLIPGTLELPFAARKLLRAQPTIDALIVFGIVIKGDTHHFEMIVDMISKGFERVMFEEDTPIIVEVLPVHTLEQAETRCADNEGNKGREAALAAIKLLDWQSGLG